MCKLAERETLMEGGVGEDAGQRIKKRISPKFRGEERLFFSEALRRGENRQTDSEQAPNPGKRYQGGGAARQQ
jgi:hypothetical protein